MENSFVALYEKFDSKYPGYISVCMEMIRNSFSEFEITNIFFDSVMPYETSFAIYCLSRWSFKKIIYSFDENLFFELTDNTDVPEQKELLSECLNHLPYNCFAINGHPFYIRDPNTNGILQSYTGNIIIIMKREPYDSVEALFETKDGGIERVGLKADFYHNDIDYRNIINRRLAEYTNNMNNIPENVTGIEEVLQYARMVFEKLPNMHEKYNIKSMSNELFNEHYVLFEIQKTLLYKVAIKLLLYLKTENADIIQREALLRNLERTIPNYANSNNESEKHYHESSATEMVVGTNNAAKFQKGLTQDYPPTYLGGGQAQKRPHKRRAHYHFHWVGPRIDGKKGTELKLYWYPETEIHPDEADDYKTIVPVE